MPLSCSVSQNAERGALRARVWSGAFIILSVTHVRSLVRDGLTDDNPFIKRPRLRYLLYWIIGYSTVDATSSDREYDIFVIPCCGTVLSSW